MSASVGVAVIGAGMAGKAHAAAYRAATAVFDPTLPPVRLVSIADVNPKFGQLAADRFGYERYDSSWQAIAEAKDIDVVSVVIANSLHLEAVKGLLEAGKHVLCEKPLSDTLDDARTMAALAREASSLARIGFTFRRAPGLAYLRQLVQDGTLGKVLHFCGRYLTDYGHNPKAPMSWRYEGEPGSGALADVGSHLTYLAEFLCGDITAVSGGRFATVIGERPLPLGAVMGHDHAAVSDTYAPVGNDDYATLNASFGVSAGTLECSRVAAGHPNGLMVEIYCENGAARFDQARPAEIELMLAEGPTSQQGFRRVLLGAEHPYISAGLAMDAAGVGFGQNDAFIYQARAFLDEVVGTDPAKALPPCATFDEGVHNMEVLAAVAASARQGGATVNLTDPADAAADSDLAGGKA